jgi:hypothetical protein
MCQTAFTVIPSPPCPSYSVNPAEKFPSINCGGGEPIVQFGSHPIRNRNRSDVASLANQINNGPMFFALLEMLQSQRHGFMPPQAAREQQCEQCSVAFSFQSLMIGCLSKCLALLRSQPIAETHSQLLHAFNTANASRQIGAEGTAVGGLVCEPMFLSWFIALGPFLLLAARKPSLHRSLITFAACQSLAHASVMTIQTVEAWKHGVHRNFTDVVLFGVIGGILLALTLEKRKQSAFVTQ